MTTYVALPANEAAALDPEVTARTRRVVANDDPESPFVYLDTASSRAGIGEVAQKLMGERVAIVGLGGTGAYVLDQVAKTAVARIDLFDDDYYLQHNAFRSEEHTSELQSLMRISYAVFCLKKKNTAYD